jgi:drug/metabolite transporter (DMT)-like permease
VEDQAGQIAGLATCVAGLFGITVGTLYQKRFGSGDLRSATVVQNAAAFLGLMLIVPWVETIRVEWRLEMVLALAWLCLGVSIGALSLFLVLLRRGAASRITSLFYLVPRVTALMAYFLFGETIGATALGRILLTAAGVALVNR